MNKTPKIVEKSTIFFIISAMIIAVGIVLLIVPGMNLGLDFTPGATITFEVNATYDSAKANEYLSQVESYIEEAGFTVESSRKSQSNNHLGLQYNLTYNDEDLNGENYSETIGDEESEFVQGIKEKINAMETMGEGEEFFVGYASATTSPDATRSTAAKAFIAIAVAIVCMLIYIAIRFRLTSGIAAVIVLIHDVFVMITLTTACRITVNITFIAAVITVIGYSINATIIVFDRIKDNLAKYKDQGLSDVQIANISIKETIRRTLLTTITTLVMIGLIAIVCSINDVTSIIEFALPIIFGLLSGLYSAIVLSSCVWVQVRKLFAKFTRKSKKGYSKYAKEKSVDKSVKAEA